MQINCLFVTAATETSTFFQIQIVQLYYHIVGHLVLEIFGGFRTVEPQTVVALLAQTADRSYLRYDALLQFPEN